MNCRLGLVIPAAAVMTAAVGVSVAGLRFGIGIFFVDRLVFTAGVVLTTSIRTTAAGSVGMLQIQAAQVTAVDRRSGGSRQRGSARTWWWGNFMPTIC